MNCKYCEQKCRLVNYEIKRYFCDSCNAEYINHYKEIINLICIVNDIEMYLQFYDDKARLMTMRGNAIHIFDVAPNITPQNIHQKLTAYLAFV